jgi:hypothetical protein
MKKYLFTILLVKSGLFAMSQSIIHLTSGNEMMIAAGERVSFDGLVLNPSSNFTLQANTLTRNTTITRPAANPTSAILRTYYFANNTAAFTGIIRFYYTDAELNGATESLLVTNVQNGSNWTNVTASSRDGSANYIEAQTNSYAGLREITLTPSNAVLPIRNRDRIVRTITTDESDLEISIYPNPVTTAFNISDKENVVYVTLSNALGNEIKRWTKNDPSYNIAELSSGVYYVTAYFKSGYKVVKKIIK